MTGWMETQEMKITKCKIALKKCDNPTKLVSRD